MKLGILGGGTIARLTLESTRAGRLPGVQVLGIGGRGKHSRAVSLAEEFGVAYWPSFDRLVAAKPQLVLEAASHQAVRDHLVDLLDAGISAVVLSAGALVDDALRMQCEAAAARGGALLYVPSGGIGGLDALKGACVAGAESVNIRIAKPPAAWKNIAYVEGLGIDLDRLREAATLFDGPARAGVPHFPQNVNIAAVLSLAGVGFDRTRLTVVADPELVRNTHTIEVSGKAGRFTVLLENVPAPDNPKTALLACYSALAAIRQFASAIRYGT